MAARVSYQEKSCWCRWPNCTTKVERWRWGCSPHWFMLPESIRQDISRAWARGRGEHGKEHAAALRAAEAWIADYLGLKPPVPK